MSEDTLLAALDVGTNSFHLVIARVLGDGRFEVVTRDKEIVRLGHGGGDMRSISPEAMSRAIEALKRFQALASSHGAPMRAVATSAVREADNASEFLAAARRDSGVDIEVISGVEEARLIHLGVLHALDIVNHRVLLIDIGGGSTEVLVAQGGEELAVRSFKLGAVRLTDRFFPGGSQHPSAVSSCRIHIRSVLSVLEREVSDLGFEFAVVSSGTAETLARMVHARRGDPPIRSTNALRFTRDELDAVVDELIDAASTERRRRLAGLESSRADIILAGALILDGVAHSFDVAEFVFSDYALREGVMLDTIRRRSPTAPDLHDVARRSVEGLMDRCDDDPAHSRHVASLAASLFDQLASRHGLEPIWRQRLEAASLLANVGLVVSHSKHHLHSYYVIRNSDLVGLTDHEIELIAQIARYHRKSPPKPSHEAFARLDEHDQRGVRVLAGILRIAIGLDRRREHRVTAVKVRSNDTAKGLEILVETDATSTDIDLELYAAQERRELLEAALGVTVTIRGSTRRSQRAR